MNKFAGHNGCFRSRPPSVQFPVFSKFFSEEKIIDVAKVNQRRWLEESGQWLENIDPTHLVLASGKPVLQKKFFPIFLSICFPSDGLSNLSFPHLRLLLDWSSNNKWNLQRTSLLGLIQHNEGLAH